MVVDIFRIFLIGVYSTLLQYFICFLIYSFIDNNKQVNIKDLLVLNSLLFKFHIILEINEFYELQVVP